MRVDWGPLLGAMQECGLVRSVLVGDTNDSWDGLTVISFNYPYWGMDYVCVLDISDKSADR